MRGRIGDEAVKKATGKTWAQWFAILDTAGARAMSHRDIARMLHEKYFSKHGRGIDVATSGGWWSQMVTVEYERERGIRKVNQNETGFLVAVHKTVEMPISKLQKEWQRIVASSMVNSKKLERVPSKTKRRMLRYKAAQGGLVVSFDERGNGKSRIMVEAIKLPNKAAVERERVVWRRILDRIA
jgi:hypothetical protein